MKPKMRAKLDLIWAGFESLGLSSTTSNLIVGQNWVCSNYFWMGSARIVDNAPRVAETNTKLVNAFKSSVVEQPFSCATCSEVSCTHAKPIKDASIKR